MKIKNILYKFLIPVELLIFYYLCTQNDLFKIEYPILSLKPFDFYIGGVLIFIVLKQFIKLRKDNIKLFNTTLSKVLFIIVCFLISFAAIGKSTFLSSYDYAIQIKAEYLVRYFLTTILIMPITYVVYNYIVNLSFKLDKKDRTKNDNNM